MTKLTWRIVDDLSCYSGQSKRQEHYRAQGGHRCRARDGVEEENRLVSRLG